MGAKVHGLRRLCPARRVAAVLILIGACGAAAAPGRALAQGFSGELTYTGSLGPVTDRRPLCVCIYTDAELTSPLGCVIKSRNGPYSVNTRTPTTYFVIAFLDIHVNERLDPDEPFEIFHDRAAVPGDPVVGDSGRTDVDFVFGDENLPGAATPTETQTATPTETQTATPTVTPVGAPLTGDCDGSGVVSINELVHAVAIALGTVDLSTCRAADEDGDGRVRVYELIRAVAAALDAGSVAALPRD